MGGAPRESKIPPQDHPIACVQGFLAKARRVREIVTAKDSANAARNEGTASKEDDMQQNMRKVLSRGVFSEATATRASSNA